MVRILSSTYTNGYSHSHENEIDESESILCENSHMYSHVCLHDGKNLGVCENT